MAFAQYSKADFVIEAEVQVRPIAALCIAIFATACAAPDSTRDARGNPRIERMSEEQVARLADPSSKLTPEDRAKQTDPIDAQVRREAAEAEQRKASQVREALERQRALQTRRYDPYYGDPYSAWAGVPWPGYWGWRWNYPPRNGIGMFWRGR